MSSKIFAQGTFGAAFVMKEASQWNFGTHYSDLRFLRGWEEESEGQAHHVPATLAEALFCRSRDKLIFPWGIYGP